jgi:hypothetical protein
MIGQEEFTMANKAVRYTPEFKRQMVDLVRAGRTPAALAKEFGPTLWSISLWVKLDERDAGKGDGRLTSTEREELSRCGARTASSIFPVTTYLDFLTPIAACWSCVNVRA